MREEAALGEPGYRGDVVALEREHEQPVGARDRSLGVGEVAAEGRLAVGTGGDESEVRAKALGMTWESGRRRSRAGTTRDGS